MLKLGYTIEFISNDHFKARKSLYAPTTPSEINKYAIVLPQTCRHDNSIKHLFPNNREIVYSSGTTIKNALKHK